MTSTATTSSGSSTPSLSSQPLLSSSFFLSNAPSSSLSSSSSSAVVALPSALQSPLLGPSPSSTASTAAALSLVTPYYDPELFTVPPPDHLLCAICTGVVHSPLNLACSHLFCAQCLAQWCQTQAASTSAAGGPSGGLSPGHAPSSPTHPSPSPSTSPVPSPPLHACPTCRAPFSLYLASPNHAIQHVIANMEVRCPNHEAGCPTRLQMGLRERNVIAHRRHCGWEKVRCRYAPDCRALTERRHLEAHERTECSERSRECEDCGELVKCGVWEAHRSGLLGCVGLVYCPHRCRAPAPQSEDDDAVRKRNKHAEEVRRDDDDDGDEKRCGLQISVPGSPANASSSTTSSSSSPAGGALVAASLRSSPPPQLFVSSKRKFGTMTNPSHLTSPSPSSASSPSFSSSTSSSSELGPLTVIRRSAMGAHLSVCPLRLISCDLCPARFLRSELESHFHSNLTSHLVALAHSHRTEQLKREQAVSEAAALRKEAAELRWEVAELHRQIRSSPLFAFFFDIHPLSLLGSHYVSNDFVCGDHVYCFALHRQGDAFSAFVHLKSGAVPVQLSYVLMVKRRKRGGMGMATADSSPAPLSPELRPEGEGEGAGSAVGSGVGAGVRGGSVSPAGSLASSASSVSSHSAAGWSSAPASAVCLRVKVEAEFGAAEGKGISNWFTLADLAQRGGYSADEDAITIGVLIKDHASSWVYSAADALHPALPAPSSAPPAPSSALELL